MTEQLERKVEETGGGGNCFFTSVAHCVQNFHLCTNPSAEQLTELGSSHVRNELSNCLNDGNVVNFVKDICEEQKSGFLENSFAFSNLDVDDDNLLPMVKEIVETEGTTFQALTPAIAMLAKKSSYFREHSLGIAVASSFGPGYMSLFPRRTKRKHYILINNDARAVHFQALYVKVGDEMVCYIDGAHLQKIAKLV
jgi:hypothetical protein